MKFWIDSLFVCTCLRKCGSVAPIRTVRGQAHAGEDSTNGRVDDEALAPEDVEPELRRSRRPTAARRPAPLPGRLRYLRAH